MRDLTGRIAVAGRFEFAFDFGKVRFELVAFGFVVVRFGAFRVAEIGFGGRDQRFGHCFKYFSHFDSTFVYCLYPRMWKSLDAFSRRAHRRTAAAAAAAYSIARIAMRLRAAPRSGTVSVSGIDARTGTPRKYPMSRSSESRVARGSSAITAASSPPAKAIASAIIISFDR